MTKANVVTTGALFRKCFIQNTSYYHSPSMPGVSPQIPEVSPTRHLKAGKAQGDRKLYVKPDARWFGRSSNRGWSVRGR